MIFCFLSIVAYINLCYKIEITNQQNQSTISHPISVIPEDSDPAQALRAESAFFRTKLNQNATTTVLQINTAAGAASPNAWESALDEMAHNEKHAGNSKDEIRSTTVRTESTTIKIGREELTSFIHSEAKSAVEAAGREDMRGLIEDTISEVFTTEY